MNQGKYIGMDVHAATISAAVKNAEGKPLMECVLETKAATILEFIQGLRGCSESVTNESTWRQASKYFVRSQSNWNPQTSISTGRKYRRKRS